MPKRYSAFLSYSHADRAVAAWLHHALETFRVPAKLIGQATPLGPAQRKLLPVFRDREELPASGNLGRELMEALSGARFLIVIASPRAAASRWVGEEVLAFKRQHGPDRVLALIADGEPGDPEREPFPPALRFQLDADGALTTTPAEPIAADIRPGGDGRRLALLKLIAGLTGLPLDALARRDAARRQRRLTFIAAGASAALVLTSGLALYANTQRIEAERQRREAVTQRRTAEASLDFLIGTFEIANPATENPRTITAITLLNRVSERVKTELVGQPAVSARLLRATGDIYNNLGLPREGERDLRAALTLEPPIGEARALTLAQLAQAALRRGDVRAAEALVRESTGVLGPPTAETRLVAARLIALEGRVAYLKLRPRKAVRFYERAIVEYEKLPGDNRLAIARILMNEGKALNDLRDFAGADRSLKRAETIFLGLYGPNHVQTAIAIQNRAFAAFEAGRHAEASASAGRSMAIFARVLEPAHPSQGEIALLAGRIAHANGDLSGAAGAFVRARTIFDHLYGPENAAAGDAGFYLAGVQSDQGERDAALATLARTKRAYDASYGPLDPDQAELLATRALILRAAGRPVESARDCDAGVRLLARLDPRDAGLEAARRRCADMRAEPPRIPLRFFNQLAQ